MGELDTNLASGTMDKVDCPLVLGNLAVGPKTLASSAVVLRPRTSPELTASCSEIRPSGTTAVASIIKLPHPRMAILPWWTKWKSVPCPLSEESAHVSSSPYICNMLNARLTHAHGSDPTPVWESHTTDSEWLKQLGGFGILGELFRGEERSNSLWLGR